MTCDKPICERALLSSVSDDVRPHVEEALAVTSVADARASFEQWMDRYAAAEIARSCADLVDVHEFGGHLRPMFARHRVDPDPAFLHHCRDLFTTRRDWALTNLHHGYPDGAEVHHQPEAFLYFQIPLLDLTDDPEVLASIEDVAAMSGNWVPDVPQ